MPVHKWSEHIWVSHLPDGSTLGDELDTLDADLRHTSPTPDVVLDLSALTRLNSSHLGQLLRMRELLERSASRLRLVSPPDVLWTIFLTAGLDRIFRFSEDTATALAELQLPQ